MKIIFTVAFLCFLFSCSNRAEKETSNEGKDFSVKNFNPLTNWKNEKGNDSLKTILLDYSNSINTGFIIPTINQVKEGQFVFSFEIKNKSTKPQPFYYKIYYQNESYKFPEKDSVSGTENEYATENFYGSWENTEVTFKSTQTIEPDNSFHTITDSIRIVGNPRNEKMCFENGRNDRWKRNPRTGEYSFMLVVTQEQNIRNKNIPDYIQNISLKNREKFNTPYYYFLFDKGAKTENTVAVKSTTLLKVIAQPDLGNGIYISPTNFDKENYHQYFTNSCGQDTGLYMSAPFSQLLNNVDPSMRFENIPIIADILKDNYSKRDYNWNRTFYKREELISTTPQVAAEPCQTVFSDAANHKIVIKDPKTEYGKWRKESVGVISRHGITYGKWRIKCKLTELLNKSNIWNGLTNAIWLICQPGSGEWNNRRSCNKEGYMATYWGGPNDKRVPIINYSEIDFEILKTPPYCPDKLFPPVYKIPSANQNDLKSWDISMPDEIKNADDKITVACTNWDMACWEPKNFGVGCNSISYNGKTFNSHRWDDKYRAITQKTLELDDELFGSEYYYFEIEWKPTEIIWRIGPKPDKMHIVGYMNNTITSIPNNQMCLIITQEYHNTKWWPGSPYQQDNLPFPKNDIFGEIYELTIE